MTEETPPDVRPAQFWEQQVIDAYKDTIKGAIASADKAMEVILTASFSIVTAYGALIALVSPKNAQAPLVIIAPFAFFAAAMLLALSARLVTVPIKEVTRVDQVAEGITKTFDRKRTQAWCALASLVIGIGASGYVAVRAYGTSNMQGALILTTAQEPEGVKPGTFGMAGGNVAVVVGASGADVGFALAYGGLSGPATEISLHRGGLGETGPMVQTICGKMDNTLVRSCPPGRDGTIAGVWKIPPSLLSDWQADRIYINVYTSLNSAGEIRGQILSAKR